EGTLPQPLAQRGHSAHRGCRIVMTIPQTSAKRVATDSANCTADAAAVATDTAAGTARGAKTKPSALKTPPHPPLPSRAGAGGGGEGEVSATELSNRNRQQPISIGGRESVQHARIKPGRDELESTPLAIRPARRLPVQKDWPAAAIVAVQIGILVAIVAGWEI